MCVCVCVCMADGNYEQSTTRNRREQARWLAGLNSDKKYKLINFFFLIDGFVSCVWQLNSNFEIVSSSFSSSSYLNSRFSFFLRNEFVKLTLEIEYNRNKKQN